MSTRTVRSADGRYQYQLQRWWDTSQPPAVFVTLNPSDSTRDDRTISRIDGIAAGWGCGGVVLANLFAYRATDPAQLFTAARRGTDIVGPRNDAYLVEVATAAAHAGWRLIACWGPEAPPARVRRVLALPGVRGFQTLGAATDGYPQHPLHVRGGTPPQAWGEVA